MSESDQNSMNIVVAVNDNFVYPLKVMLYSLACNTERELKVYLMYCDLSERGLRSLKDFVGARCHGRLHEIRVSAEAFREHDAAHSMFSVETFYRLFIPYMLPKEIERALWLDADMVVCGNIEEFYDSEFGEDGQAKLVAAWNDRDKKKYHEYKERLGEDLKADSYFNSGVVLYNIPAIRETLSLEEIMEFWHTRQGKLKFLDQDMLNCLLGTDTVLKDSTLYNNQAHADEDAETQLKQARVIHYITYRKPWKLYYEGSGDRIFWKYAKECGFYGKYMQYRLLHRPVMAVYRIYKRVRYGN